MDNPDIWLNALLFTLKMVTRMGLVMGVSLFVIECLMQLGLMKKLEPLARPLARFARLPSESAVCFLTALGSLAAANAILAGYRDDGRVTRREAMFSAVLNAVPLYLKQTLTYQLPLVLPLLGWKLCIIYMGMLWLAGMLKLLFVLIGGRIWIPAREETGNAFDDMVCHPDDVNCLNKTFRQIAVDAWNARKKLFFRMVRMLAIVTFIVQILTATEAWQIFNQLVAPAAGYFGFPGEAVGPISVYILSPTAGITAMSALLQDGRIAPFDAIAALIAGGFIMIPVARLKGTLPRYSAIFGFSLGATVCAVTASLSLLARVLTLVVLYSFIAPASLF